MACPRGLRGSPAPADLLRPGTRQVLSRTSCRESRNSALLYCRLIAGLIGECGPSGGEAGRAECRPIRTVSATLSRSMRCPSQAQMAPRHPLAEHLVTALLRRTCRICRGRCCRNRTVGGLQENRLKSPLNLSFVFSALRLQQTHEGITGLYQGKRRSSFNATRAPGCTLTFSIVTPPTSRPLRCTPWPGKHQQFARLVRLSWCQVRPHHAHLAAD